MAQINFFSGFVFVVLLLAMPFQSAAFESATSSDRHSEEWSQLVDILMPVWTAASHRDEQQLISFVTHNHPEIRNAAWRGLGNFSVGNTDRLLDLALEANLATAWFALSTQFLNGVQIQRILDYASDTVPGPENLSGVYLVLGKQGDDAAHSWFMNVAERCLHQDGGVPSEDSFCASEVRFDLALAVSRSVNRHHQSGIDHATLLQLAMQSEDVMEQAAWMYGWYRTPAIRLPEEVIADMEQWIASEWPEAYGLTRQYWLALLGRHQRPMLAQIVISMPVEELHVLEWVESARALANWSGSSARADQALIKLLDSPFDQVRVTALETTLARYVHISTALREKAMVLSPNMPPMEQLSRLRIAVRSDPDMVSSYIFSEDGVDIIKNAPSLVGLWLGLVRDVSGFAATLQFVGNVISDQQLNPTIRAQLAYYAGIFLSGASEIAENAEVADATARAGVIALLNRIATDSTLASSGVVAAAMASLSNNNAWIGAAAERSAELSNFLRFGADFEDFRSETLLVPEPDVLKQTGPAPEWLLHTTSGTLSLRLDPLRSPATVTAYYNLTRDEMHDGTSFHRIVPNFVIQAGMLWDETTAGSPAFRIPTEASEKTFSRGALGVASAGRDTEGSQFFVMHMWHPHLDGGYTNFGHLVEGHDVLDALLQGATVVNTEWR